ncbi:MAG: outer membrane protein transport protein [Chromatiales bacterium]|nr:outer membrane protein transport protein [Chromatiales bacterium]
MPAALLLCVGSLAAETGHFQWQSLSETSHALPWEQGRSLSQALSEDLWLGFALSTPLRQQPEQLANTIEHRDGKLTTLQPALAWQASPQWSLGAGLDIQRSEASGTGTSTAIDDIATTAMAPGSRSDAWYTGFNLGMSYKFSEQTRIDWQYRTAPSLHGRQTTGQELDSPLPEASQSASTSLGFAHQTAERWTVLGQYTRFESMVQYNNVEDLEEGSTEKAFAPRSWALSLGSEYRLDPNWTLRGGMQYSQEQTTTLPGDSARLALGAAYRSSNRLSVEMAYTHELIRQQSLAIQQDNLSEAERGNGHSFGLGLRLSF